MTITAAKLAVEVGADTSAAKRELDGFDDHLRRSAHKMRGSFGGIGSGLASTIGGVGRSVLGGLDGLASSVTSGLRGAAGAASAAFRGMASVASSVFSSMMHGARNVALAVGGIGIAAGAVGLKTAADMEQATVAFTTMLGSASAAKAHMQELAKFSAATPFELSGVINMSRMLQGMGFAAGEITPLMTAIGDSVAAMGGGADELARVTRALGQMRAKGKVSAEEMLQLSEIGINGWELLASATGKSVAEVQKLASEGKITADVFIKAFKNMQGPLAKFKGAMEAQSKTLRGMWSTMKDTVTLALADMATPMAERISQVFPRVQQQIDMFLRAITPQFAAFSGGIVDVFGNLMPVIGPILQGVVGGIGAILTNALPGFAELTGKLGGLFAALAPHVEDFAAKAGTALSDVLSKIAGMVPDLEDVGGAIKKLKEMFAPLLEGAKRFGGALVGGLDEIAPQAKRAFKAVVGVIGEVLSTLAPVVVPILKRALGTIARVLEAVAPAIEPVLGAVADAVIALFNALQPAIKPIIEAVAVVIVSLAEALKPVMPVIVDALQRIATAIASIAPEVFRNLADAIVALVQGITKPDVLDKLAQGLVLMAQGIAEVAPLLPPLIPPLLDLVIKVLPPLTDLLVVLGTVLPPVVEAVAGFAGVLLTTLNPIYWVADAASAIIDILNGRFGEAFSRSTGKIALWASNAILDFGRTVRQWGVDWATHHPKIMQWLVDTAGAIKRFVANAWSNMAAAGRNIIMGLWEGIRNGWVTLENTIGGLAGNVIGVFRKIFEFGSPSKVTTQHGVWLMEGLAQGIRSAASAVDGALTNALGPVAARFEGVAVHAPALAPLTFAPPTSSGVGASAPSVGQSGPVTVVLQVDGRRLGEVTLEHLNRLAGESTVRLAV